MDWTSEDSLKNFLAGSVHWPMLSQDERYASIGLADWGRWFLRGLPLGLASTEASSLRV